MQGHVGALTSFVLNFYAIQLHPSLVPWGMKISSVVFNMDMLPTMKIKLSGIIMTEHVLYPGGVMVL